MRDEEYSPSGASGPVNGTARLERLVEDENVSRAWAKVKGNKGAPGIDGVTIGEFERRFEKAWPGIGTEILNGAYRPQPIRAVDIRKDDGGVRTLGIANVQDRVILQAITQILTPLWEPYFSSYSFAYRAGRSALDAVAMAQNRLQSGRHWIVDLDIEKFFDHVDHVRLMLRLRERIEDARLLDLIGDFLRAGILHNGVLHPTRIGIAQGSPLSPLLANIVLDQLDQEYMRLGWNFVRYADDCILFARSEEEGKAMLEFTRGFLEDRLKLHLNPVKTRVVQPTDAGFLGFTYRLSRYGHVRRRIAPDALAAYRIQIQQLTRAKRRENLEQIFEDVAIFFRGWSGYYQFSQDKTLQAARHYACGQLRACAWAYWDKPAERYRQLRRLGASEEAANQAAFGLDFPDAGDDPPILLQLMNDAFFEHYGLKSTVSTGVESGTKPLRQTLVEVPQSIPDNREGNRSNEDADKNRLIVKAADPEAQQPQIEATPVSTPPALGTADSITTGSQAMPKQCQAQKKPHRPRLIVRFRWRPWIDWSFVWPRPKPAASQRQSIF